MFIDVNPYSTKHKQPPISYQRFGYKYFGISGTLNPLCLLITFLVPEYQCLQH
jgi:hypothetical protein